MRGVELKGVIRSCHDAFWEYVIWLKRLQILTLRVFKTSEACSQGTRDSREIEPFNVMSSAPKPYETHPEVFRLDSSPRRKLFQERKQSTLNAHVVDSLEDQVAELLIIRQPKLKAQPEKLASEIRREIGPDGWDAYGVWAWFPWRATWVRLLPESAFIEVRTNRNRNKINQEEQDKLGGKTVGIVGLSVGSSLAVTLAMERICGRLKLADFDTLELSNLNRIQTGVHHLGIPKTVAVARAIAEVDPFFEVELVSEGFTSDNAQEFFEGVDCVVDACDQVQAKANMRWHAREAGIPLIMETSDRGMLDIERYDQSGQAFLHGRISDDLLQEMRSAAAWTPAYFDAFIDVAEASARGVESLQQVGETLVGWPQLYSDVAGGGAHAAQVIRKIFLGDSVSDARHYLEWNEQLIESVN